MAGIFLTIVLNYAVYKIEDHTVYYIVVDDIGLLYLGFYITKNSKKSHNVSLL